MARRAVVPVDAGVPEIVERYLSGVSMQEIAKEKRVDRRRLYDWMFTELGPKEYQEVVTRCLVARVSDADDELEAARLSGDPVRVSAARETCRFVRMDLERRRPSLYGPKQEVKHTQAPVLNIVLLDKPSGSVTPVAVLPEERVVGGELLEDKVDG